MQERKSNELQMNSRCLLVSVSLCPVLIIVATGCGLFDNEWVGDWTLDTINGVDLIVYASRAHDEGRWDWIGGFLDNPSHSYFYYWTFDNDGTWYAEGLFKANNRNISFETTGTYSLFGSNYTLTGQSSNYTPTQQGHVPVDENTGFPVDENIRFANIGTGTWSRKGDTLTLNSDAGHVLIFKRYEQ